MTPERLAEIRASQAAFPFANPNPNGIYAHRRDLLAEVDRLTRQLAEATERGNRLHSTLSDVIGGNWRFGEPGYRARQSAWIEQARFDAWHNVLNQERRTMAIKPPQQPQDGPETGHQAPGSARTAHGTAEDANRPQEAAQMFEEDRST